MKHLQRRLKNLESALTDPLGLVPHTQRWLEYWDRQYYLFLSGQDLNAIWESSIAVYRAVMKYAYEDPDSLTRKALERNRGQNNENDFQTASAA